MKLVRNIKAIRIDWLKVAEALNASNPYGPMIGPDGTIYSFDGQVLVTGSDTAAQTAAELPSPTARPLRDTTSAARSAHAARRPAITA